MSTAPSTLYWYKPTLVSPQSYTSLTLTKTDIKRGSGKLTAGYVRSLKCLSDYEKNHTPSLCGGVHVTAFRRSRQEFSSLSPIITQQMTARHTEHCTTTVRRKMNTLPLHLTHSASDLMNDVTDPRQPTDRSGDRKKLFLCTCSWAGERISCWHGKQQWKHFAEATVTHLCQALITISI